MEDGKFIIFYLIKIALRNLIIRYCGITLIRTRTIPYFFLHLQVAYSNKNKGRTFTKKYLLIIFCLMQDKVSFSPNE